MQWLSLWPTLHRERVQSLVGELGPCRPCGTVKEKANSLYVDFTP